MIGLKLTDTTLYGVVYIVVGVAVIHVYNVCSVGAGAGAGTGDG